MKPRSRPGRPPPVLAPVPPLAPRSFWRGPFGYVAVGLAGFALGASATWRFVRDDLEFARRPPVAPPPAAVAPPAPGAPPADIGAGLPDGPRALAQANWLYDQRRWADAARDYERALALGQDSADLRTDLANCFRFLGQTERALAGYRAAQAMDPRHENSLFNLGTLYQLVLRDRARAIETLRLFVARFPLGANAANARAALAQLEAAPPEAAGTPTAPPLVAVPAPTPPPAAPAPPVAPAPPAVVPSASPAAPAPDAVRDWLERRAAPTSAPPAR